MMMNEGDSTGINQCLCLPKASVNTKNSTTLHLAALSGSVFGVELGLEQTQALINTYGITLIHHHCYVVHHPSWLDIPGRSAEYQAMMDD